jgi:hypothetical protein
MLLGGFLVLPSAARRAFLWQEAPLWQEAASFAAVGELQPSGLHFPVEVRQRVDLHP